MIPLDEIVCGDSLELCQDIPDGSCQMVFCDPVYWEIPQYEWVAELAFRILVPGGNLMAQTGSEYRYEAETAMRKSQMTPRPLLVETYSGGFMQMWKHRSLNGYAGYLWMTKGETIERVSWVPTWVRGGGKNKDLHEWQDSPAAFIRWISAMTSPGDTVVDPFTGSGTVPAVCKMMGRHFMAFEIDPEKAEIARQRVDQTQVAWFTETWSQDEIPSQTAP